MTGISIGIAGVASGVASGVACDVASGASCRCPIISNCTLGAMQQRIQYEMVLPNAIL